MTAIRVTDHLSNVNEHIVEAAKAIGRSARKRKVFEALYYHKRKIKTVGEICAKSGLSRMQVLQAGGELKKARIIDQTKLDGETAYVQIEFFQHNKPKILRLVENPEKIKQVSTKRNPAPKPANNLSFVKRDVRPTKRRKANRKPGKTAKKIRIAFLTTNPDSAGPLRTDLEARNVLRKLKSSPYRNEVQLNHIPAAEVSDLLDALNEFKPNIIHFSGHGGGELLLFDNPSIEDDGGCDIDFEMVHEIVSSTRVPPVLLVFNACDTFVGAEIFLETVDVVVAMSSSVTDATACVFSEQFYYAISCGQSVEHALKQGKVVIKAAGYGDSDLPTILAKSGVRPDELKFID